MAFEEGIVRRTVVASADFSASQYFACVIDSSGQAAIPASGANIYGIMQDKPIVGRSGGVAVSGVSKAVAGAAVAAGATVMTDNTGKLITATSTNYGIGIARTAASGTGIVFAVDLIRSGKV